MAAFARFVLHLMRLAAPPDLLLGAIRAMEDEVHHARLCFGIASRLTGEALGPGEFDLNSALDGGDGLVSIVEAAIIEGCVNETISVRFAEIGAERAEDSEVRSVLLRIVADEARHADLAWRFLEWVLRKHPQVIPRAEACFAEAMAAPAPLLQDEPLVLERYGQLVASSRANARQAVLRDTIAPRTARLGLRVPAPS